ncbi:unnamed protein product [Larinioides sclopetarius]|uniref:Uncharacterized protein n=1 Tax=Larinioides sclopetarius TaxID=280406 RepID=A0AAV1YS63_9ARAC
MMLNRYSEIVKNTCWHCSSFSKRLVIISRKCKPPI